MLLHVLSDAPAAVGQFGDSKRLGEEVGGYYCNPKEKR